MIGFPGVLRHSCVLLRRHNTGIGVVLIRVERGLHTVHLRDLRPQRYGTLTTAIPDVKGDDLAGPHGDPDPLLARLLPYNAPQLIGCSSQLPNDDICWANWSLDVSGLGTGRKARDHKVQSPRQ